MPEASKRPFTHSHIVLDDGTVSFKCSSDKDLWPWLALEPCNPITVQAINYWASVETGAARGSFDPDKWSALTQTQWHCNTHAKGHATHGVAGAIPDEDAPSYSLTFFDATGALVYHMSGTGVVFRTRDFEKWRKIAKQKFAPLPSETAFEYAPATSVGVATQKESFLSPLSAGGEGHMPFARALIKKADGFMPNHPYHSGSGDHVNSNQLADLVRQFACLQMGHSKFTVSGGEMKLDRYIELDRPFRIQLAEAQTTGTAITVHMQQNDKPCATISLKFHLI